MIRIYDQTVNDDSTFFDVAECDDTADSMDVALLLPIDFVFHPARDVRLPGDPPGNLEMGQAWWERRLREEAEEARKERQRVLAREAMRRGYKIAG